MLFELFLLKHPVTERSTMAMYVPEGIACLIMIRWFEQARVVKLVGACHKFGQSNPQSSRRNTDHTL